MTYIISLPEVSNFPHSVLLAFSFDLNFRRFYASFSSVLSAVICIQLNGTLDFKNTIENVTEADNIRPHSFHSAVIWETPISYLEKFQML